jgi:REP element-mobilizing transposase RayT
MFGIKRPRLPKYDYRSNGYYFVTVVANWRQNIFKNKEKVVEEKLFETAADADGATVDTLVIMPNHVHFIVVLSDCQLPLGEIVRRFKARVSRVLGVQAWQPNYYEHVIRNEDSLNRIREYIRNNPQIEVMRFEQFNKFGNSRR